MGKKFIPVFISGEVYELEDSEEAREEFRRVYLPVWRDDDGWAYAYLLRRGLLAYYEDDKDRSEYALRAIDNTLRILGLKWSDVEDMLGRRLE